MRYKRVCLIVLDSLGIGEARDAASYGDAGANTFGHIAERMLEERGAFKIPNLTKMGAFGKIARLREASKGKDTTTGHWEIAGLKTEIPFLTYPNGFPEDFMKKYEEAIGIGTLGNTVASGTEIIERLGPEHEATLKPIIYTSADSVFQIAACVDLIPLETLYRYCEVARSMLTGDVAVGRVIARPYIKHPDGSRERTSDRRDYSVDPTGKTLLDFVKEAGKRVYAVGKISDIFNAVGITDSVHIVSNMDGVDKTIDALKMDFEGLIFTNLVDFDAKFGHRRDPIGYGRAIEEFDERLPEIIAALREDDLLMLTADHGNDPTMPGTDHTREDIPLLAFSGGMKAGNLGTRESFADIGKTIAELLGVEAAIFGSSFADEL